MSEVSQTCPCSEADIAGSDYRQTPIEVTVGADVLLILTEWDDFKWISPTTIATTMNGKQIIDARNLLDRKDWERAGFTYQGIGR